ncbi:MAG TPA: hypothetical protein VJ984_06635 [Xanthomonadales bacterium]|nr:hypothetical protein [Xanthomonadales bacterium]
MNSIRRNAAVIGAFSLMMASQPLLADDGWDHNLAVYLWGADIAGKTSTGQGLDVDFSDILDHLEMAGMASYEGRSDKWSVLTDVIYLDLSENDRVDLVPPVGGGINLTGVDANLDLEGLVVQAGVGYQLADDGEGTVIDFVFGARYLDLSSDLTLNFDVSIPEQPPTVRTDLGDSVIDALVGFKGRIRTGNRWFMPWSANVGTGESDLTWGALVGIGYQATDTFNIVASYRYLRWEFDDDSKLADLDFSGPLLGAVWRF